MQIYSSKILAFLVVEAPDSLAGLWDFPNIFGTWTYVTHRQAVCSMSCQPLSLTPACSVFLCKTPCQPASLEIQPALCKRIVAVKNEETFQHAVCLLGPSGVSSPGLSLVQMKTTLQMSLPADPSGHASTLINFAIKTILGEKAPFLFLLQEIEFDISTLTGRF